MARVIWRCGWMLLATFALAGCAATAVQENFESAQAATKAHVGADVRWLVSDDARTRASQDVDGILAKPLDREDAVRIALAYSPAVQTLLFEAASTSASITQSARLPNPVFSFERLVRSEAGLRELEIGRVLAFSLYDLILLPSRLRLADYQQEQTRYRLAGEVIRSASEVRQAWVRAVAAEQALQYHRQVSAAAGASAELARRMQAAGNFSKLQRAREQAFSAEAVVQLARAERTARVAREALVRALGLDAARASRLTLPDRLPDLPAVPRGEQSVMEAALDQRLDIRIARRQLDFTAREQGLARVTSYVNSFTLAGVRNSETGREPQRGYDLDVPLPIFDFGDATRLRAEANYMAAVNRTAQLVVNASSQVREAYVAYRVSDDLARHYRDEIVPLRKTIAEENVLRYNGMLIGVFELLADAREQITSVVQAIDAQRDFWLADAALEAALIGQPAGDSATAEAEQSAPSSASRGH